jgi:hypothetical protein
VFKVCTAEDIQSPVRFGHWEPAISRIGWLTPKLGVSVGGGQGAVGFRLVGSVERSRRCLRRSRATESVLRIWVLRSGAISVRGPPGFVLIVRLTSVNRGS